MSRTALAPSELILNPDGSIYHLQLKPGEIANTIITVGDPDRVEAVTKHFDSIEVVAHHREFKTHTGMYKGKRLSVVGTGIGTDNIDIVLNELDALVNIDFNSRTVLEKHTQLTFIRVGTSGSIQPNIPIDSFLISEKAVGFDNLLHFYGKTDFLDQAFAEAFMKHSQWNSKKSDPYVVSADPSLVTLFDSEVFIKGITATNAGFYGPQGRKLRLALEDDSLNDKLERFRYQEGRITNLEMETAALYGLAMLLGHKAISLNVILANRALGTFSNNPQRSVNKLIEHTLATLVG